METDASPSLRSHVNGNKAKHIPDRGGLCFGPVSVCVLGARRARDIVTGDAGCLDPKPRLLAIVSQLHE